MVIYEQELQYPNKFRRKFKSEGKGMVYGSIGCVVTKFMESDSIYPRTSGAISLVKKN
jgi:hypothetical protein